MSRKVVLNPAFEKRLPTGEWMDPGRLLRPPEGVLVARHARRSTARLAVDGPGGSAVLLVKRRFRRPLRDAVRDLPSLHRPARPPQAQRRALAALAEAGLPGPAWMVCAEERRFGLPPASAPVVKGIANVRPLDEVIDRDWPRLDRGGRRQLRDRDRARAPATLEVSTARQLVSRTDRLRRSGGTWSVPHPRRPAVDTPRRAR